MKIPVRPVAAGALAGALLLAAAVYAEPAAAGEPNRASCAAIRGTAYHSAEERAWYWKHCIGKPLPASTAQQFADGYRWAGGPEHLLAHILNSVIPCESNYDPSAVNWAGPYYGLMQFSPSTWYAYGGGDWYSAWQQGVNTARLVRASYPGSHWPYCWFA